MPVQVQTARNTSVAFSPKLFPLRVPLTFRPAVFRLLKRYGHLIRYLPDLPVAIYRETHAPDLPRTTRLVGEGRA